MKIAVPGSKQSPELLGTAGFRPNVAMAIADGRGQLFLAERPDGGWQMPQGGIADGESVEQAMYRELEEETGLKPADVQLISVSRCWYSYRVPSKFRGIWSNLDFRFKGQTQCWFLLRLRSGDEKIYLGHGPGTEFVRWCWAPYWYPLSVVAQFKKEVYRCALSEFSAPHAELCRMTAADEPRRVAEP